MAQEQSMVTKVVHQTMSQTPTVDQLKTQQRNGLQLLLLVMLADTDMFIQMMTTSNQESSTEKSLMRAKDKDCVRILLVQ